MTKEENKNKKEVVKKEKVKRERNEKHSVIKLLIAIAFVAIFLSWVLKSTILYSGNLLKLPEKTLFNLSALSATMNQSLIYFADGFIFLLMAIVFYSALSMTDYKNYLVAKKVDKYKDNPQRYGLVVAIFLAVLQTLLGLDFALIIFMPFFIEVMQKLKYRKSLIALILVAPLGIGLMGSTLAVNLNGVFPLALEKTDLLIHLFYKLLAFVLALSVLLFFIVTKYEKDKNEEVELTKEDKDLLAEGKKQRGRIPTIIFGGLAFITMIISHIPWNKVYKVDFFEKLVKTKGWFAKIFGEFRPFGEWQRMELSLVLLLATILIVLFSKIKVSDLIDKVSDAIGKYFKVIIVFLIISFIVVATSGTNYLVTIVNQIAKLGKGYNLFTIILANLVSMLLAPHSIYATFTALPVIAIYSGTGNNVITMWQFVTGFSSLLLPTSLILALVLSYLEVPYSKYIKENIKYILMTFIILLIMGVILIFV